MIIGIDQSLRATGICIIDDDNGGSLVHSETINTEKLRGIDRINVVCSEIGDHLSGLSNAIVVREGYSYSSTSSSTYEIGELGGRINKEVEDHFRTGGVDVLNVRKYHIIPPTTWKKFALGNGSIKKDSGYLLKVYDAFELHFEDDNQADAFMMAHTVYSWYNILNNPMLLENLEKHEREALVSPVVRKSNKITAAGFKKLEDEKLMDLFKESMETSYTYFGRD